MAAESSTAAGGWPTKSAMFAGWVLTAVFGSGWYWQYKSANLEQHKSDAADLTQRLSLREQTTQKLLALAPMLANGDACKSAEQLVRMKALVSDLIEFERQLAILEKREPRDLYKELLRPCPPSGLTVQ